MPGEKLPVMAKWNIHRTPYKSSEEKLYRIKYCKNELNLSNPPHEIGKRDAMQKAHNLSESRTNKAV